jgi:hypothetical protein
VEDLKWAEGILKILVGTVKSQGSFTEKRGKKVRRLWDIGIPQEKTGKQLLSWSLQREAALGHMHF